MKCTVCGKEITDFKDDRITCHVNCAPLDDEKVKEVVRWGLNIIDYEEDEEVWKRFENEVKKLGRKKFNKEVVRKVVNEERDKNDVWKEEMVERVLDEIDMLLN